jgi:hypothetical protein
MLSGFSSRFVINSDNQRRFLRQTIELRHVLLIQLKAVYISVLSNSARIVALRERSPTLLQTVSNQDLCGCLAVLLGNRG